MNSFFDRVFIINLERRHDRRDEMKREFSKDWNFVAPEFMAAVDGNTVQTNHDQGPAVFACGQSHLAAVRKAIAAGCQTVLILEDDSVLCDDFPAKAESFLADLPSDWEIAWLGGEHRQPPRKVKPGIVRNISTDRLHCYALSRSGMIKLERIWSNWHKGRCDWELNKHLAEFKAYAPETWLVGQRAGMSDISNVEQPERRFESVEPPADNLDYKPPFSKAFVINLPHATDRLRAFRDRLPSFFGTPCVWRAVYGELSKPPAWWRAGNGAWGVYRSHLAILESAMQDNLESFVVFEDDAVFKPDAKERLEEFLSNVPDDWEQLYLGGQLLDEFAHPPKRLDGGILVPWNVNRLHAVAFHRRSYEKLYHYLLSTPFAALNGGDGAHIDHHIGRLHEREEIKVYVPHEWICGQSAGLSSINGHQQPENWWPDPIEALEPRKTAIPHIIPINRPNPLDGVGTEVSKILKSIGVETAGCGGCMEMVLNMNQWGIEGCRGPHRQEILERLREKAAGLNFGTIIKMAAAAAYTGLWTKVNWSDPAPGILDEAIRIVEDRERRPKVSACMPTRGRPITSVRSIKSFYETTKGHSREMIVCSHPDESLPILQGMEKDQATYPGLKVLSKDCTAIEGWNWAAKHARGEWLKVWDDDLVANPGWLDAAFRKHESVGSPSMCYLGLWDTDSRVPSQLFTRAMGTRSFFVEACGGVITIPAYARWYDDNEKFEIAQRAGCAWYCPESKIDHHQAATGRGPWDATAQLGQDRGIRDAETFEQRKRAGFPISWLPMITN